eukprot:TRINITY_DN9383_c0_g1_i1.p1 TRINITY_DN9383_c0_g1~~TRINITY_DN9383_c0_g1_i1.p1  ORF type:complete len:618 (-),score=96.70 TRINITY_DN9383_c0_g1_i1:183-2036(-)
MAHQRGTLRRTDESTSPHTGVSINLSSTDTLTSPDIKTNVIGHKDSDSYKSMDSHEEGSLPRVDSVSFVDWDPLRQCDHAFRYLMKERRGVNESFVVPSIAALVSPFIGESQKSSLSALSLFVPTSFDLIAAVLLCFSFATRFYRLGFPNEVIFDEVHFGGFTNNYIKGVHFFDIHPPLTKLLFFFLARIIGYDGHYDFEKITNAFDDDYYYYLRSLPAFAGSFVPIFAYMTIREFGANVFAATVGGIFLICDMCLLVESRIIVTDGVLMFFVAAAFFTHSHLRNLTPMTSPWYRWLFVNGICIAGCISTKWTALGTMAIIGLDNLYILIFTWGGKSASYRRRDWFSRGFFLLCIPLTIYLISWILHFHYLPLSGPGDGLIPKEVQKRFIGNKFANDTSVQPAGLFEAIAKVQIKMYVHNKAITQPHGSMSSWWSWPFMVHGMGYWGKTLPKESPNLPDIRCIIYLMGNPFVWWTTTAALISYISYIMYTPWRTTNISTPELAVLIKFAIPCGGYMLNWLPYIFVPRVTFLYHYLPSLFYAVVLFALILDHLFPVLTSEQEARNKNAFNLSPRGALYLYGALCVLALCFFFYFSPDTYAFPMTRAQREAKRWFDSWH